MEKVDLRGIGIAKTRVAETNIVARAIAKGCIVDLLTSESIEERNWVVERAQMPVHRMLAIYIVDE